MSMPVMAAGMVAAVIEGDAGRKLSQVLLHGPKPPYQDKKGQGGQWVRAVTRSKPPRREAPPGFSEEGFEGVIGPDSGESVPWWSSMDVSGS